MWVCSFRTRGRGAALAGVGGETAVGPGSVLTSESGVCLLSPYLGDRGVVGVEGQVLPPPAQPQADLPSSLHVQGGSSGQRLFLQASPRPGAWTREVRVPSFNPTQTSSCARAGGEAGDRRCLGWTKALGRRE